MSIFGKIVDKLFHHKPQVAAPAPPPAATQAPAAPRAPAPAPTAPGAVPPATPPSAAPVAAVDVEAVLTEMAAMKGGGGNWRTSIVDLLNLLGLEHSLAARHELAEELNVHVGADGTAEQNIALYKAVMKKLAENGGIVPDSMRD